MKTLNFGEFGLPKYTNWEAYPNRSKIMIKAIAEPGIKNSLEVIKIPRSDVSREEDEEILKSFGMEHITIY